MPNLSILGIGAYYGTVLGAHIYAIQLLKRTEKKTGAQVYSNVNPRGEAAREHYRKLLAPGELALFERARAAHANGLENFPLFAAAVLAAHQAGLREDYQNAFAVAGVGLRVLYTLLYVNTESEAMSFARTVVFFSGTAASVYTIVRAGLTAAGHWNY